jgi:hypothetical protein
VVIVVFSGDSKLATGFGGGGTVSGGERFAATATIGSIGVGENETALGKAFYEVNHHTIDEGIAGGIDIDGYSVLFVNKIVTIGGFNDVDHVLVATASAIFYADANALIGGFGNGGFEESTQTESGFFGKGNGHFQGLLWASEKSGREGIHLETGG